MPWARTALTPGLGAGKDIRRHQSDNRRQESGEKIKRAHSQRLPADQAPQEVPQKE